MTSLLMICQQIETWCLLVWLSLHWNLYSQKIINGEFWVTLWPWIPSVRLFLSTLKKLKTTKYAMTVNIETIAKAEPAFSIQHPDVSLHTPVALSSEARKKFSGTKPKVTVTKGWKWTIPTIKICRITRSTSVFNVRRNTLILQVRTGSSVVSTWSGARKSVQTNCLVNVSATYVKDNKPACPSIILNSLLRLML